MYEVFLVDKVYGFEWKPRLYVNKEEAKKAAWALNKKLEISSPSLRIHFEYKVRKCD